MPIENGSSHEKADQCLGAKTGGAWHGGMQMTAGRYRVSICRLDRRARFEMAGPAHELFAALQAAGLPLPPRVNSSAFAPSAVQVDWLGPRRVVVTAPMADEASLHGLLLDVFGRLPCADMGCTTDMVSRFELAGPGAADVLAQGTALDLSDQAFAPGSATVTDLWGVAVVVERPLERQHCRCLTVDCSLAGFIQGWLQTANGQPSGPRPGVMRTAGGAESVAAPGGVA